MTTEKLENDVRVVHKFIQLHCNQKHKNNKKIKNTLNLNYKGVDLDGINYDLCKECVNTLHYSYERLLECPHDEKPSCRKCPKPCYEKSKWKNLAKIMRYSGMQMGLLKIRKLFRKN